MESPLQSALTIQAILGEIRDFFLRPSEEDEPKVLRRVGELPSVLQRYRQLYLAQQNAADYPRW